MDMKRIRTGAVEAYEETYVFDIATEDSKSSTSGSSRGPNCLVSSPVNWAASLYHTMPHRAEGWFPAALDLAVGLGLFQLYKARVAGLSPVYATGES